MRPSPTSASDISWPCDPVLSCLQFFFFFLHQYSQLPAPTCQLLPASYIVYLSGTVFVSFCHCEKHSGKYKERRIYLIHGFRNKSLSYGEGIAKKSSSLVNHVGRVWPRAAPVVAPGSRESQRKHGQENVGVEHR